MVRARLLINALVFSLPCMVALLAVLFLTSGFWAPAYNRHVFPLGRLYGSLRVGDPYPEVRAKFTAYYAHRRQSDDAQLADSSDSGGRFLHLYDLSLFDDVQVTARFDAQDRLATVDFIGD